ncbi:hypothetical protein HanHA300_Chr09g0317381 [Helianthus annuus]|nr:hypothetical protein HanHA300_Chr09g0317381 [Helianthus annuus]KAJ0542310.1 hypothetical protein HanHA89_Chr09g0338361 [Helianthus annuus]KAJ0707353.1 hypothetical protein HanLR1_Chr09g0317511 [Helianthus annuus]
MTMVTESAWKKIPLSSVGLPVPVSSGVYTVVATRLLVSSCFTWFPGSSVAFSSKLSLVNAFSSLSPFCRYLHIRINYKLC